MTDYLTSVGCQQVSITIPINATSATATITAVGATAFIVAQGFTTTDSATNDQAKAKCRVELTNTTTVTAYRNTSDASITCTANAVVVDATSSLVSSVQNGTVSIAGTTSGTATVSAITTANSGVFYLGDTTSTNTDGATHQVGVTITNTTTVTANVNTLGTHTVGYCLVNWNPAVLQSNVQQFAAAFTSTSASDTQTITGVTANNAFICYGGNTCTASSYATGMYRVSITNGTTVTLDRNGTASGSRTPYYAVVEFISGVLNQANQRGSLTLSSGTATATITSISTTYGYVAQNGLSSALSTPIPQRSLYLRSTLTNGTTITGTAGGSTFNQILAYEAIEFVAPASGPNTLTETVIATDSEIVTRSASATLNESNTATDSYVAAIQYINTINESNTLSDNVSILVTGRGLATETNTAADAISGAATGLTNLNEAGTATDSHLGIASDIGLLTETETVSDSFTGSGAATYNDTLTETVAANDNYASQVIPNPNSVTETPVTGSGDDKRKKYLAWKKEQKKRKKLEEIKRRREENSAPIIEPIKDLPKREITKPQLLELLVHKAAIDVLTPISITKEGIEGINFDQFMDEIKAIQEEDEDDSFMLLMG